jgi:hypothetical protein
MLRFEIFHIYYFKLLHANSFSFSGGTGNIIKELNNTTQKAKVR